MNAFFEVLVPLITFFAGFYAKNLFDIRDTRRAILDPAFSEYEKVFIYLRHEYRNKQMININDGNHSDFKIEFSRARDELIRIQRDLVYACKKIQEFEMADLAEKAFEDLITAMSSYDFFGEYRDTVPPDQRTELLKALKRANENFDETSPVAMEKVYSRYWTLVSSVIFVSGCSREIIEIVKCYFRKMFSRLFGAIHKKYLAIKK